MKTYEFILADGGTIKAQNSDAISAFTQAKKAAQNLSFKIQRYEREDLPPSGYSLLGIGYGLSVAYRTL